MLLNTTQEDFNNARKIARKGGKLYIVGGCIRDTLLNRLSHDKDYCITGLKVEDFLDIFPHALEVGKSFPVFLLEGNEYAFARKEKKVSQGHKGFSIYSDPSITIKEDLNRRDLTINAMAYDILEQKLIDPFNGQRDLENKLLYPVSDKFKEDPLRVYRVARFASQLNFIPHDTLIEYMNSLSAELNKLPVERVFSEFKKAMQSNNPHLFIECLRKADLLHIHFPEIFNLIKIPQVKKYHPEGDVYTHTILSLKEISKLTPKPHVRFAVLMHDIGKGLTPIKELPHHYQHHTLGLDALNCFALRLKIPNKWYNSAFITIKEHMKILDWRKLRPGTLVRLFEKIKQSPLAIYDITNIARADKYGRQMDNPNLSHLNLFELLYYKMFTETRGKDIDSSRYQGKEFGEQLFQYRCQWIKNRKEEFN